MASVFTPEPAYKHDEAVVTYFPVTAGETFKKGAFCVLTTGALVECGANPAIISGIALCDASVGLDPRGSIYGGTLIPFIELQPDMVLKLSSATTPDFATHMGKVYGITKTSGIWQLDISKTGTMGSPSNGRFSVVDLRPLPGVPAAGGGEMFLCKMLPQFSSLTGIAS